MNHLHRFRRYVLVDGFFYRTHRIFSNHMEGWYVGYACRCGEPGYAVG